MRIITCNVNGIRSAHKKGFFKWVNKQKFDVLCLQELKAHEEQIPKKEILSNKIFSYYKCAQKKGYSGVSIHSKTKPKDIIFSYGDKEFDDEGRYIEIIFDNFSVVSLYAPSGSSGDIRQEAKFRFMKSFMKHLKKLSKKKSSYIICGDWNIAHKEIDLKNWKGNKKNSGFLPEEREWLDKFIGERFIDSFRLVNSSPHQYSWWSYRANSRANNKGWRIDYNMVSKSIEENIVNASILSDVHHSDHCPIKLELSL